MNPKRFLTQFFYFGLLLFSIIFSKNTATAQTYCYQFAERVVSATPKNFLDVDVFISPSSTFRLGDTRIVFSYNAAALSLTPPLNFTSALDGIKYTVNAEKDADGIVVIKVTYNGLTNAGTLIPTSGLGLKIGTLRFTIENSSITREFKLVRRDIKQAFLLKDDNVTPMPLSAQCPPSPYSSLFYDLNIDLDTDIPMEECVEANEPNSVKLNFTDDETREILPPGFKFKFYCEDVTSLRLGADGALLVNAPNTATLPNTNVGKLRSIPKVIAPLWDEWRKGMGSVNCLVRILPSGQRVLIVQWNDVSPVDNVSNNNLNTDALKAKFNVVFFENTSIIKFNYKDIDFVTDAGSNAGLVGVAELKQYGIHGSVGIKGLCANGTSRDAVNNIIFDGPTAISLYDVREGKPYKSITFLPISEACVVPTQPVQKEACQNDPAFKLDIQSSAVNGKWTGTGTPFLNNVNIQAATFNPTQAGNFTLNWEPDCMMQGYTVNIKINQSAIANAGRDTTICAGGVVTLNGTIGGVATSGSWSAPVGSGTFGNPNSLNTTFTPNGTTGSLTLTLTTNDPEGPCPAAVSTLRITLREPVEAGTDGISTICGDDIGRTINLYNLISGEQSGGTWTRVSGTGGNFDPFVGTFRITADATSSRFKYTLLGTAPCPNDSSFATINITPPPVAGTSGSISICEISTTTINLADIITGEQSGGKWTRLDGVGGIFNATLGTFTPQTGATSSVFRYVVTGAAPCDYDEESLVTVNILKRAEAGNDGSTTICDNSTTSINLFNLITNEQAGGTWTRTSGTGGNFDAANGIFTPALGATSSQFKYTVSIPAPCASVDDAVATVTIAPQANAGLGSTITVCSDNAAPINLFDLISGEQSGGTWTRVSGTGGNFNFTLGTFTPSVSATNSVFRYTVTGVTPCPNSTADVTINIQPRAYAGEDGDMAICDNAITLVNLRDLILNEQNGGTWTRISGTGGDFNATNGTFTVTAGATTSQFRYTILGQSPCPNDEAIATITIRKAPNAGIDDGTILCDYITTPINLFLLISGEDAGGTWTRLSGTGGDFNATNGTFTPARGATSSRFQYTVRGTAPCIDDISIATIELVPQAYAGEDRTITVCNQNVGTLDLFSIIVGEQTGGTWVRTAGTGGIFDAATGTFTPSVSSTNSTFMYRVRGTAPCVDDLSFATINLVTPPDAGADGNIIICNTSTTTINLYNLITGEQNGGAWTRQSGSGGSFDPTFGLFTPSLSATTSVFRYTVTSKTPCIDDYSEVTITIRQQPNAGLDTIITVCDKSTNTINLFGLLRNAQTGGYWNRIEGLGGTFSSIDGTFTPAAGAFNSVFQYTVNGSAPCANDNALIRVNILPTATPEFDPIEVCQFQDPIPLIPTTSKNGITGTWSPQFIDIQTVGTKTHTFDATNNVCITPTTLLVTVKAAPTANAGIDQTYCDNVPTEFKMDASAIPAGGTGVWAFITSPKNMTITNVNNPKTTITGVESGEKVRLLWTVTGANGCIAKDEVLIGQSINPPHLETYNKNSVLAGSITDPSQGDALICANIVIKELRDDCTSYNDLFGSLRIVRDSDNPTRTYRPDLPRCIQVTCADVNTIVPTQVWVVDNAGNATFRFTYMTIQDNMGFCRPRPQTTVAIATNGNLPVKNVKITASLQGTTESVMDTFTNNNGLVLFNNLSIDKTYFLKASKEDDKYWGVSTYDIAVISQHILGIKTITSPYELLAADVNEDGEIDGLDIVTLRNFILRRNNNLPRREWRFIDSSYVFQNPQMPFAEDIAEAIKLDNRISINRKAFKAIKKGDVTPQLTQPLNTLTNLVERKAHALILKIEDVLLEKGKTYAIPIVVDNFGAKSFQFTLNTEGVSVNRIERGDLTQLSENQCAIFDKYVTTSWNGAATAKTHKLFTLHITAQQTGSLRNSLRLSNDMTPMEALDKNTEIVPIHLEFNQLQNEKTVFHLYQNFPNPFSNNTTIAFNLPKAATTRLTIMTLDGKTIHTQSNYFESGYNTILLDKKVLNTEGVLLYRLEAEENVAVQRMVVIR